jgi:hypothetical protein
MARPPTFASRKAASAQAAWSRVAVGVSLGIALGGCAVAAPSEEGPADSEAHALVRLQLEDRGAGREATVLSAFVSLASDPTTTEGVTFSPAGVAFPVGTGCVSSTAAELDGKVTVGAGNSIGPDARVSEAGSSFLLAESVELRLSGGSSEKLSPYAFPRLGRRLGGAVYSSGRLALPPQDGSEIEATLVVRGLGSEPIGGGPIPERELRFAIPWPVGDFAIQGVPVRELDAISVLSPLDFTWTPRSSTPAGLEGSDYLVVELRSASRTLKCGYPAPEAVGSIPPTWLRTFADEGTTKIDLSVHALGQRPSIQASGLHGADVRFDATLARSTVEVQTRP